MTSDILTSAVIQAMTRSLSVSDLIRTADTFKQSKQAQSLLTLYSSWIQHNEDHPLLYAVLFNYAVSLTDAGKLQEARAQFERAISINPDFIPPYINLGRVYERLGQTGAAIVQWSAALAKTQAINGASISHKTTLLNQSARTLESVNQDQAAEDFLQQSLEIDNTQREVIQHLIALRQRQCRRPVVRSSERVSCKLLLEGISPLSAAAYTDDPAFQLAVAWNYNRLDVGTLTGIPLSWPNADSHSGPLKIGYLSSDLREHAVGYLMTEVFELHNRNKVEVYAYYCGPDASDSLHERFKSGADHWISINHMGDAEAAQKIRDDGIQILIDLNGYTREARLKVVAQRPAPIIVNWLGFPGSMGSPYHNYILADEWIIPEASEIYYSEKVLRLPCYQPNNRNRVVATKRPTRGEAGLPEDAVVFCCFNGAHKITRFTFERWMLILKQTPNSVLWLLSSTDSVDERLKKFAAEQGVSPDRIIFAGKVANPYHLSRYVLADLMLDATPYGAHTTASDALWMGIPVLTQSGRSFASRVCGSLLRAAGLHELVTDSADDFIRLAIELGNDPNRLKSLRQKLLNNHESCTLFDMPRLVQTLEDQFGRMWSDYNSGMLPVPDLRNLDVYLEIGAEFNHEEIEVQNIDNYESWWRKRLDEHNRYRPIAPDERLFSTR